MQPEEQKEVIRNFVDRFGGATIKSTGAFTTNYSDVLYNVSGSTIDPPVDGKNWKELLLAYGISGDCYVTNEDAPEDSSHPGFDVGGHMTPNPDGQVPVGADTYLMPLCKWHNNPARNGVPFTHDKTFMLKLTGYMQSEFAATFLARMPSEETHALVFASDGTIKNSNLTDAQVDALTHSAPPDEVMNQTVGGYLILKRQGNNPDSEYTVVATSDL